MNIKFYKVVLDGFMSFDHEEISLLDLGLVQLNGRNLFEPLTNSNGSGKSAIFEAILWSITGSTSRGATEVGNNILNKGVYVTIELSVDDVEYSITRSKNHCDLGSSLVILRNGEDISGNTLTKSKEILSTELGNLLDYDTLTSIIVLSQGLPGRLSTLKPSSRKSRLEELSKTDHYLEELQSKLSLSIATINTKISEIKSKILQSNTRISSSNLTISTNEARIAAINSKSESVIDSDTATLYESQWIPELQLEISGISTKINQLNSTLGTLSSELSILQRDFEKGRQLNETYVAQYDSIRSSKCPTCGQELTDPQILENTKRELELQISNNKTSLISINQQIAEISSRIPQVKAEVSQLQEEYSNKSLELTQYTQQLQDYKSSQDATTLLQETIISEKKSIEKQLLLIEGYNKELDEETEQLGIANYYKNQLSRKFRSFLLEGVVSYMNNKSKEYSPYLFENQGCVSLVVDGNNINIYLGDRRFENLSGGEGRRVDIILQLIQRDLARNESGFSSSLLVLDEILDNLDATGADSVIRLLEYKSPDIDSLIIVSHKQDITIPSDKRIVVEKGADQISHIYKGE